MSARRLNVRKTYKLYIGGAFARSESGRVLPANAPDGRLLDNYSHASRKDLRDAVAAARPAGASWARKTPYLRGQILYRTAEMLENRASELAAEISRSTGADAPRAQEEVSIAIDTLVYFAGWTDKYAQVFGSINPVATPHFNFTTPEPVGVTAILAPDQPALAALVSLLAPVILSGNSAVVIASERYPLPALTFAEVLATSDLPGGVANILAGKRAELLPHLAGHLDINAIINAVDDPATHAALRAGVATNLKRYVARRLQPEEWLTEKVENAYWIGDTVEFKTAWHPIGL